MRLSCEIQAIFISVQMILRVEEVEMNYPEQIEQTSLKLAETSQELASLREHLAGIEAIAVLDIASAKTPEGKPLYSNDTTRSAALTLRLRDDSEAVEVKGMIERAEQKRSELFARLERLRGEFKLSLVEQQARLTSII